MAAASLNLVFCPPQLGKPDPREPRPLEGPDTRTRVLQRGSKDNTCWYYVFNALRERYKAPNTVELKERIWEQIASKRRKAASAHERSLPDIADQLNQGAVQRFLTATTLESIKTPEQQQILNILEALPAEVKLSAIIPRFLEQTAHRTLYDYLVYCKLQKRSDINLTFLSELGTTPQAVFSSIVDLDPPLRGHFRTNKWAELAPSDQNSFSDHLAKKASADIHGLKVSAWSPSQPIDALIGELQKWGPLSVNGSFGLPHYQDPPMPLGKQLGGQEVYGWSRTARKVEGRVMGHAILLVGAEKTGGRGGGVVYYNDPMDDSDPAHPEKRRNYAMSYERLTSDSLADNYGILRRDAPATTGYALHR